MKGTHKFVVLDSVDEIATLRRNPNLDTQYAAVKTWGIPILFRVVAQAQWYCDLIAKIKDESAWDNVLLMYTVNDMSAMLQNPHRAVGWVIAAAKDEQKGTTNTWIAETMKHIEAAATAKWHLPYWFEFSTDQLTTDTSLQLVTLKDLQNGEWVSRLKVSTMRETGAIELPDNLYSILNFIPSNETGSGTESGTETETENPPVVTGDVVPLLQDVKALLSNILVILKDVYKR
jgi:hypothetical protein